MKKALLIIFCVSLMLSGCAPETAEDGIVRLPWPSHAPGAEPYISTVKEKPELPSEPEGEFYNSWEEMLASIYVGENNFWFNDWEFEMFKNLPQNEPYYFTVHPAATARHENSDIMKTAEEFTGLGIDTEVWDIQSVFDGEKQHYYVCFIRCTPNELWEISGKTEELYKIEQKYETVAERCDVRIYPSEGDVSHG